MAYFHFHQNNSGGCFTIDDKRGLGPEVWIEADDLAQAESRAEGVGIYFNGVESGDDCPCCGDRWSAPWDDPVSEPEIDEKYHFYWHDTVYVHRLDGSIGRIAAPTFGEGGAGE